MKLISKMVYMQEGNSVANYTEYVYLCDNCNGDGCDQCDGLGEWTERR